MKTRNLLLCALFTALTAVGAFVKIPFAFSAITLQFFFTALAGILLGARAGALSQLLYVALGLLGLPVFALGGGIGYVLYPTFGFLLGLIPAAYVVGRVNGSSRSPKRITLACLAGLAVLYAVGLPYMALILNVYQGRSMGVWALALAGMLPYLPGDCVKIAACAYLAPKILRAFPDRK